MAGWHAIAYSTCLTYYILHLGYHTKSNTSLQLVHCQSVIVTLMSPACPVYPVHLSPLFVPTQAQNSCTHRPITRHTATPALQCPSGLQKCNCVLSYDITRCAILTHTNMSYQHLSSHWLSHFCCRPGHARSGGSLALDMDSLQMAAAEASSTRKQDSPRTIMIKANLKKVSLENFNSMPWHLDLSWLDTRGDHSTVNRLPSASVAAHWRQTHMLLLNQILTTSCCKGTIHAIVNLDLDNNLRQG